MGHSHLKILYLKSKLRQLGAKIKTSSDLLENVYTSQFEGAKCESDIGISYFFIENLNLGKLVQI